MTGRRKIKKVVKMADGGVSEIKDESDNSVDTVSTREYLYRRSRFYYRRYMKWSGCGSVVADYGY